MPVVNALTPLHHPCQALADLLTLRERFGRTEGLRVAYVGDGNNVCHSLMLLGARAGVEVVGGHARRSCARMPPIVAAGRRPGERGRGPGRGGRRARMRSTPTCG